MEFKPTKIIFHHTASASLGNQFNDVNEWHKKRGFPLSSFGYYVGYHLFIERDGMTIFARNIDEIGAHCRGQNEQAIGIGMAGNFDIEYPTPEQIKSLGQWCNVLMKRHNISIRDIYPHRRFRETHCPGLNVEDKLAGIAAIEQELSIIRKIQLWIKLMLLK